MQPPIWLKLALSLAGFLSVANAQPPDRIYPIMQLTDRDVAEIDVTDGSVEDWENIVGEPTLTPLDFAEPYGGSYDPSDMDFRIWLGWHDATDRIFFAMERVDDVYVNEFDREDEDLFIPFFHDSSVEFAVDGDHSGGAVSPEESPGEWLQGPTPGTGIRGARGGFRRRLPDWPRPLFVSFESGLVQSASVCTRRRRSGWRIPHLLGNGILRDAV